MTLTQELTTIESITRCYLSDLRIASAEHSASKEWKDTMLAILDDALKNIEYHQVKAVIHGQ